MMVIDASVWVSFYVQQDINYAVTHAWLTKVLSAGVPIAAPILLLSEVGGAIARRLDRPEIGNRVVNQLLSIPSLRLVSIDHNLGINAGKIAAKYKLRGADAMYVTVAAEVNIPLVSWDKEHLNRTIGFVDTYSPNQYPRTF
jgi:predicted nucleic acid-binding protein